MLHVFANASASGRLDYDAKSREFVFNYTEDNPISLTMPYSTKSYTSHYHIHPIFDMSMPEGYLFELLKNLLIKEYGEIDDFILFSHLSRSIEGYLTYDKEEESEVFSFTLDEVLQSKDENIFATLVNRFLNHSAIAGVQPKVLAQLEDKAALSSREYIIKSFSSEYPHLAENEYFCMKALTYAGITTPKFWLSESKKLFIMEKFTYQKEQGSFYGFEEFCVLFKYNKEQKYYGSYEKVAKSLAHISTQKQDDLRMFYKMMLMNYLLKNGDAHLKNFGVLYTADKKERFLAPAYDVVNTLVYLPHDKPALTLVGKKVWVDKKTLMDFGISSCMLSEKEALSLFEECVDATKKMMKEIECYSIENPDFQAFGEQFLKVVHFSLSDNIETSYKDACDGIL
ncbi:MAG: phosphatidylinositol kinase [Sulfurovum sp.]|nr:MAG: phosphatidylinositol kinase [Sulfurovum sp.]